jgi:N-methylhydantoinase B
LGNIDTITLDPGEVLHIHSPGGAGRGSPLDREPERVLRDVRFGYVTAAAAEAEYGVVIRDGAVDEAATEARRAAMRAQESDAFYDFGPERDAFEQVWTPSAYAEMTTILAALPVHWRFFVKTRLFEALREATAQDAGVRVRAAYEELRRATPGMP